MNKQTMSMVKYAVGLIVVLLIFLAFRTFLTGNPSIPGYASELAAAFLGGALTIILTAMLLNKQTEVELRKERNVRVLEEKLGVYNKLYKVVESVLTSSTIQREDKLKMQMINQELVKIASLEVIRAFNAFQDRFSNACVGDNEITDDEMKDVLKAMHEVSLAIRLDVASYEEKEDFESRENETRQASSGTIERFSLNSEQELVERSTKSENEYFSALKEFVKKQSDGLSHHMGKVGFSIKKNGKPVLWCYPITTHTKQNLLFHKENLGDRALALLRQRGGDDARKRIPFLIDQMPLEVTQQILMEANP